MRPTEITDEMIIRAGNDLLEAGRPVTKSGLREMTGGGKSDRLMSVWLKHISQSEVVEVSTPVFHLPSEIASDFQAATADIQKLIADRLYSIVVNSNDLAIKSSELRVKEALEAVAAKELKLEQEASEADVYITKLEKSVDALEEKANSDRAQAEQIIEKLTEQLTKEQERRHALDIELATVKQKMADSEKSAEASAHAAQDRHEKAMEKLETALDAERAQREKIMQTSSEQFAALAEIRASLAGEQRNAAALDEAKQEAKRESSELRARIEKSEHALNQLAEELKIERASREAAEKSLRESALSKKAA